MRNKHRADVAILIVDDPKGCGLASRVLADAEEAFAVVHHECAATTYTVAHEIWHLIGARHDLNLDTISYLGCPRVPVWSNPKVMVKGERAGTPELDNAP